MGQAAEIVQDIQYVLAPAVMVSNSALLLLGFQTKLSNLANRFRALNQEKRTLLQKTGKEKGEEIRLGNLEMQLGNLMKRASHVKNAIILAYAAIICFTGTSILIFLNVYGAFGVHHLVISAFLLGLFSILISAVLIILETGLFYGTMALEKKS